MEAVFRFYAELNDFLAPAQRGRAVRHAIARDASVKHMIEALGVPHTEVALILVNGRPQDFSWRLQEGDRINETSRCGENQTERQFGIRCHVTELREWNDPASTSRVLQNMLTL